MNHILLENEKYIGPGTTKEEYTFYDLGGFPGAVAGGNNAIVGEIYEISGFTLMRLDSLEGHPQFYRRNTINLQGGDEVYMYILDGGFIKNQEPIIESGDWHKGRR